MENQLFSLLMQDHTDARLLMEEIVLAPSDRRHALFIDLSDMVTLHLQIEEENFYPKLQGHKNLEPTMKDALREHRETKELLGQLDRMDAEASQWQLSFRLLQQGLLKHMQIEEGDVFEKCADFLSEKQLDEIAQKCREQKQAAQRVGGRQREEEKRV